MTTQTPSTPAFGEMPIVDGFEAPRAVVITLVIPADKPLEVDLPAFAKPLSVYGIPGGTSNLEMTVYVQDGRDLELDSTAPKTTRYFYPTPADSVVNLPQGYGWEYIGSAWVPHLVHVFERK